RGGPHAYLADCDPGRLRRRARCAAALGRQGTVLWPALYAVSADLADLRRRCGSDHRRGGRVGAVPGDCGAALLLRAAAWALLPAAASLLPAALLRPLAGSARSAGAFRSSAATLASELTCGDGA